MHLILVKHSLPLIEPNVPGPKWNLSDEGRLRCSALADRIREYAPSQIVCSTEPKAAETAELVAAHLGIEARQQPGLHENDRTGLPYLSKDEHLSLFRRFFSSPDEQVIGLETASRARKRFEAAVADVLKTSPSGNIGIVAHGTVISLFVEARTGMNGFALWTQLDCPSYVVLSLPDFGLEETVGSV